ncbi:RNA ligase-domain-containing protein [Mycena alexandri]|uniref:tRNA ligase n=1 Tax=Mycena alexandri TaxID=1745969 RepID=A0AAD6X6H9_9AGAR|nr:RNA ligase-domain-containing protein [Mycena alexandri]
MARPTVTEDSALIKQLVQMSRKDGKLVRASKYPAPADPSISVTSWKMTEHKYYVVPSPFPTLARGVFSVEEPNGEHRIVARGYDKFFNIGEVGWTTWNSLEAHTAAPYTLSLKSNGCIIFIAALTPEKLLITSKHAVGPAKGEMKLSHADAGEAWLRKYLAEKGRTEADLAGVLWEKNLTAIAELCDDSFEEHVLAYPPELTGLHLHGLNERTKAFTTLPHAAVDAFAAEWGFIQTASIELPSIAAVRKFTDDVGKSGAWNGVPVEGFVVRTHVAAPSASPAAATSSHSTPPYPAGSTLFFKVKFDEPYMMYRDWREVTKGLLGMRSKGNVAGKNNKDDGMSVSKLPKSRLRRAETEAYARWVIEEIRRDPDAFKEYTQNKGIVAVRERFLKYLGSEKGKGAVGKVKKVGSEDGGAGKAGGKKVQLGKTIIVPVAIPGCGKTAVAVALSHIFGFGHTQSDDVRARKAAPVFIQNVVELLKKHDVVIADKNNHLKQHREELRAATASSSPPVRLLALNWAVDTMPPALVHRICADRVQQRGTNHQTLLAPADDVAKKHEDVLWMFLKSAQPLASSEVDEVVEMEVEEDMEAAIRRAVTACVRVLGVAEPEEKRMQEAIDKVRGYKAEPAPGAGAKKGKDKNKDAGPRYFALLPEISLEPLLAPVLAKTTPQNPLWKTLQEKKRVNVRPHVTLNHMSELKAPDGAVNKSAQELWGRCQALHSSLGRPPQFRFRLGHIVWNERVMAVTVEDVELAEEGSEGQVGVEFISQLPEEVRRRLHITVGTRDGQVPPVEAMAMVEGWRAAGEAAGKSGGVQSVKLEGVVAMGRVKGLMI